MRTVLLSIAVALSGCTHWAGTSQPVQTVLAPGSKPVASIRVILNSGERIEVTSPVISGQFLTGSPGCSSSRCPSQVPLSIPLNRIRQVETRQVSVEGTTAVIGAVGAAALLLVVSEAWNNAYRQ